ncbi:MAG TPA: ABC transporter substrate-binding protein [Nocardioidaceae bacterium]|nr:ABC transporter substrate-binding protein [Nocardioidaceae bacterium]
MIRPTRAWRAAAVLATATLVLTACGGENQAGNEPETTESPEATEAPAAKGDGELVVGQLLPQTGDLAFLGPPEFAGVDLAVQEINDAGGVLGKPVKSVRADSGDGSPNIAPGETDNLLSAGADVIVGAASSSVSLSVIDKIVNAGVVQISPANTSTAFDTYDDKGLYFRTAPSDVLQGAVLANTLVEDGHQNVAILARQDSYGEALANQVEKVFTESGGTIVAKELYDADVKSQTAPINAVAAEDPDAVVLISFEEVKTMIPDMITAGIGPKDKQVYFTDGNTSNYGTGADGFPAGTLEGVKATYPGPEVSGEFKDRLLGVDPKLKDFTYGQESYDATIISALAAVAAEDDAGTSIGAKMQEVSTGGTKCTAFQECADLLADGEDIDYDGASGPIEFNDTGSPSAATIGIYEFDKQNNYQPMTYIEGQI